jgi:hypothetical protein
VQWLLCFYINLVHKKQINVGFVQNEHKITRVGLDLLFASMAFDCMFDHPPDAVQVFRRVRTTLFCTEEFSDRLPISG